MNPYVKNFFKRGLIFGGFGPIVMGVIYFILSQTLDDFLLTGPEVFFAILSTYLLAFIHAGASVFNQVEHWSPTRSLLFHFATLYCAYTVCYLLNCWIPFDIRILAAYTALFIAGYFAVWLTVFLAIKATEKKLNARLRK